MKERILEVHFSQVMTKRGYIKIPHEIREKYDIRPGDLLIMKIEKLKR